MGSDHRQPRGTLPGTAPVDERLAGSNPAETVPMETAVEFGAEAAPTTEATTQLEPVGVGESLEDKRGYPRTAIELKVEYRKINAFFYDYTRNISRGGTFIKTPRPLEIGTEFTFRLSVPRLSEPLVLKGRVRWIVTEDEAGQDAFHPEAGMGIQFLYADEKEQVAVDHIVEVLMVEELGERAYLKLMGKSSLG